MECQYCGKNVNSDMLFCPFCGQPLDKDNSTAHSEVNGGEPQVSGAAKEGNGDAFWEDLWSKAEAEAKEAEGMDAPNEKSTEKTFAKEKSASKKRPIMIAAIVAVVLVAVGSAVGVSTHNKHVKADTYETALSYQNSSRYEDAIELYQSLDDYEDAAQRASYCEAMLLYESGDYKGAYGTLVSIEDDNDAQTLIEQIYSDAEKYRRRGDYETAIEIYQSLADYADAAQYASYCEALLLCDSGDYESAYELLISMEEYREFDDAVLLLKQIYYETRLFEAINDLKTYMKNPDSLQILSVSFHYSIDEETSTSTIAEPACIIKESGQNGFGGYAISYALCLEDDESESYQYYASCNDLDEDSYDATDDDEFYDWLICRMINVQLDNPEVTDAVDLDRVNNIMAQNQYSQISRIPDLEFEDFGDIEADGVISSSDEDANEA